MKTSKTLDNVDITNARSSTADLVVHGDGDLWHLLCKASSESEGWMKSTKVMEIRRAGCLVQVTTQQDGRVAEAVTFVPGVKISPDGKSLVSNKTQYSICRLPWACSAF